MNVCCTMPACAHPQRWLYDSCTPRRSSGLTSWGGWNRRVIYNNMFMADVRWWLSDEVRHACSLAIYRPIACCACVPVAL